LSAAVKLLRGAKDERLARRGLDRVRTYGVLQEESEEWLTKLLRRLVTAGWVGFSGDDRPVVLLTEQGKSVMEGRIPASLLLPERLSSLARPSRRGRGEFTTRRSEGAGVSAAATRSKFAGEPVLQRNPEAEFALDDAALELFEALRAHRLAVARADSVPPFVVASDRTLRAIALARPQTERDLLAVHGMGPVKAARYGAGFLSVLQERA
jgi:ATP-dependent DNA helicase RecQ